MTKDFPTNEVEQIDALLHLNANGSLTSPVPGLAIELLKKYRAHLGDVAQSVKVTDAMVERAWAAIVGSDVAGICFNASIIRADLKTGLEAALAAQPPAAQVETKEDELGLFDLGKSFLEEYERAVKDGCLRDFVCAESPVEVLWHLINKVDELQLSEREAFQKYVDANEALIEARKTVCDQCPQPMEGPHHPDCYRYVDPAHSRSSAGSDYEHGRLYVYDATSQTFDLAEEVSGAPKFDGDRVTILQSDFDELIADRRELMALRSPTSASDGDSAGMLALASVIEDATQPDFLQDILLDRADRLRIVEALRRSAGAPNGLIRAVPQEAGMTEAVCEIINRAANFMDADAAEWMPSIYKIACEAVGRDPWPMLEANGWKRDQLTVSLTRPHGGGK
jgi:hypothetical protein